MHAEPATETASRSEDEAWAYVQPVRSGFTIGANGLPILPSRGRVLTPEMVKAALEDEID